jgi:hypothetical protein
MALFEERIVFTNDYGARYAETKITEVFRDGNKFRIGLLYMTISTQWIFLDLSCGLKARTRIWLSGNSEDEAREELIQVLAAQEPTQIKD